MGGVNFIERILNRATMHGSRSTVLAPLTVALGVFLSGTLISVLIKAPESLTWVMAGCVVLCALTFLGAFIFCLITDKDSLRTEKFHLEKMAIEHGIIGDSTAGIIQVADGRSANDIDQLTRIEAKGQEP
jgi:hypothetical protein